MLNASFYSQRAFNVRGQAETLRIVFIHIQTCILNCCMARPFNLVLKQLTAISCPPPTHTQTFSLLLLIPSAPLFLSFSHPLISLPRVCGSFTHLHQRHHLPRLPIHHHLRHHHPPNHHHLRQHHPPNHLRYRPNRLHPNLPNRLRRHPREYADAAGECCKCLAAVGIVADLTVLMNCV